MDALLYPLVLLWALTGSRDAACYPPSAVDEKLLAVAPRECLFFAYWAGRTEPSVGTANRTERLLAEQEVRDLYAGLARYGQNSLKHSIGIERSWMSPGGDGDESEPNAPGENRPPQPWSEFVELFYTCPAAVFLGDLRLGEKRAETEPEIVSFGIVLNVARQRDRALRMIELVQYNPNAKTIRAPEPDYYQRERIGGSDALVFSGDGPEKGYFLVHGDYFIAAFGTNAIDDVLAAIDGRRAAPAWLAQIRQRASTERLANLRHYNIAKMLELGLRKVEDKTTAIIARAIAGPLGIANLKSVASVSGLENPGIAQRTIVETTGAPRGLLAGVSDRSLSVDDFKLVPKNVDAALVARFDSSRVVDEYQQLAKVLTQNGDSEWLSWWAVVRATIENEYDIDFAKDAAGFGNRCCFFDYGGKHGDVTILEIRDRSQAAKTIAKLRAAAETKGKTFSDIELAGTRVSQSKAGDFCWSLQDNRLIISSDIRIMERYLSRPVDAESLAGNEHIKEILAGPNPPVVFRYAPHDAVGFDETYQLFSDGFSRLAGYLPWQGELLPTKLLPARYTIEKHLSWSSYAVRRTNYGLMSETRSVLPSLELRLAALILKGVDGEKPVDPPAPLIPFLPHSDSGEQAPAGAPLFVPSRTP